MIFTKEDKLEQLTMMFEVAKARLENEESDECILVPWKRWDERVEVVYTKANGDVRVQTIHNPL